MSDLISAGDMLTITDAIEGIYTKIKTAVDVSGGSGILHKAEDVLDAVLALNTAANYYVISDHLKPAHDLIDNCAVTKLSQNSLLAFCNALDQHCAQRGLSVSSTIRDLSTFAVYRNQSTFSTCLYKPLFAELYTLITGKVLARTTVFSAAIDGLDVLGMAKRVVGGSYTQGAIVAATAVGGIPHVKVTTQIEGTGVPLITVTGLDHTGVTATWTYTQDAFPITVGTYNLTADVGTKWIRSVATLAVTGTTAISGTCVITAEAQR